MAKVGSAIGGLGALLLSLAAVGPLPAQGGEADSLPTTERVVCRSSVATGSMLNRHNVCLSERAWQLAPSDRRDEHDFTQEAALTLRSPDSAVAVQTGTADWASFPALRMRGRLPYNQLVATTSELIRRGECTIPGQSARAFDVTVPYAVRIEAGGRVSRIVVGNAGCEALSGLVGLAVLARVRRGDIEPAVLGTAGWYSGAINFTLENGG